MNGPALLTWNPARKILAVVAIAAVGGCGTGDRIELRGTVMVAGVPVEAGFINLIPVKGTMAPSAGGPITGGTYRLTRRSLIQPGTFQVEVVASRKTGRTVADPSLPGVQVEESVNLIPPKWAQQSTLEVEIKPGVNTFDIAIP